MAVLVGRTRKKDRTLEDLKEEWKRLDEEAYWHYKNDTSFKDFTDDELALLWAGCLITEEQLWGRAYDDEVYDEIQFHRTYSDQIFANGIHYYEMGVTR